jgi:3-phenylpropionate/trans-cinnamate dioxygenase ferredoxin subunit
MGRHVVGEERELREAGQAIVEVRGRSIGVFFKGDKWFALRNICPHQGAELCRGRVSGTILADDDGRLVYGLHDRVLRCPWHGFEFDLETGRSLAEPERLRVKSYPVSVEDGVVVIEL